MIKNLCSKIGVLVLVLGVSATYGQQITVGAKVGLNMNQFSQPGTTMGLNVGAYGSYKVLPFLTARIEPHYSMEGGGRPEYARDYSSISDNISSITFKNPSVTFHNIQVPLMAELTLPEFSEETIAPKLIVGMSYGMMISAMEQHTKRYTFVDAGGSSSPDPSPRLDVAYQRENVIDNYARNQFSYLVGMGLDFKTGGRTLSFDVRYRQGINDVNQLRFAAPGNSSGTIGVAGNGGRLFTSTVSFNFSMSIFNF